MGTKGITKSKKFCVRIMNDYLDIEESRDYDIDVMDSFGERIQATLDKKGSILYANEDGDTIIVPYKILKKSIIKLIKL
jgi:hypothetical protein